MIIKRHLGGFGIAPFLTFIYFDFIFPFLPFVIVAMTGDAHTLGYTLTQI